MQDNIIPIVIFVYNRPIHTSNLLKSLSENKESKSTKIIIFADGPKENCSILDSEFINKTRDIVRNQKYFSNVEINESDVNLGLASSIKSGITKVFKEYFSVIVLEDDLILSKYFLGFMNNALNFYKDNKTIFSISGYRYPLVKPLNLNEDVLLFPRASTWGWGTWRDRWEKADWDLGSKDDFFKNKNMQKKFNIGGDDLSEILFDSIKGKNNSWGIHWCYTHFINNAYGLYPKVSLVENNGFDGTGVHCKPTSIEYGKIENIEKAIKLISKIKPIKRVINKQRLFFKKPNDTNNSLFVSIILKITTKLSLFFRILIRKLRKDDIV